MLTWVKNVGGGDVSLRLLLPFVAWLFKLPDEFDAIAGGVFVLRIGGIGSSETKRIDFDGFKN